MAQLSDIRRRHVWLMKNTAKSIGHILQHISVETATTLRDAQDGEKGWTILEILAHLRDFDALFRRRAQMMLKQEKPQLPALDHEALAIAEKYNEQDFAAVYEAFRASRFETVEFFKNLSETDWERTGIHPERGDFSMTDAVIQVGMHDMEHLEQISRILAQSDMALETVEAESVGVA